MKNVGNASILSLDVQTYISSNTVCRTVVTVTVQQTTMRQRHQMSSLFRGSNVAFGTTCLSASHFSCSSAASATHASHLPPAGHSKRQNVSFFHFLYNVCTLSSFFLPNRKKLRISVSVKILLRHSITKVWEREQK
jgi:hypothetical protein